MDDVVVSWQYRPLDSWLPPVNRTPWNPPIPHGPKDALEEALKHGPVPNNVLHALLTRRLKIED